MKKLLFVIILIIATCMTIAALGSIGWDESNIQNVTTTYGTNCTFDFNEGMVADQSGVQGQTQHLAYGDGFNGIGHFISMPETEAQELITAIQAGEKRQYENLQYYHFEEQELANSYTVWGTFLKLETTNTMDVAYIESPITDEVIIIIGNPVSIANCFRTIDWGNSTEATETEVTETETTTPTTTVSNTTDDVDGKNYDSIEEAAADGCPVGASCDEANAYLDGYEDGYNDYYNDEEAFLESTYYEDEEDLTDEDLQ